MVRRVIYGLVWEKTETKPPLCPLAENSLNTLRKFMSVFRTANIPCPGCGGETAFNLVHSVNADRRADLRDEILGETFQQQACPGCGRAFRVEPEFNYLNLGRNQWITAWHVQRWLIGSNTTPRPGKAL